MIRYKEMPRLAALKANEVGSINALLEAFIATGVSTQVKFKQQDEFCT